MVGNCGATPPASKRITRFGAVVCCASIAAAQGAPVPTATVRPSSSSRAAQQIISSIALYAIARPLPARAVQEELLPAALLHPRQAAAPLQVLGEVPHAAHVPVPDPREL